MTSRERQVRHAVYQALLATGNAPSVGALAAELGVPDDDVVADLRSLAEAHHLVLRPGTSDIWMAHPFSGIASRCRVEQGRKHWYANCAWDAFAILALVGAGRFMARCPASGTDLAFDARDGRVTGEGLVHFLVPARDFWRDIGFT